MEPLSLTDRRSEQGDRRSALAPFSNGKGEWVRWLLSLLLAAFVAYATVQAQIASINSTAEARHQELLRFMQRVDAYMLRDVK